MFDKKPKFLTPNNLTLGRLVLSVAVFVPMGLYDEPGRAGTCLLDFAWVMFIIAGLTDLVDGYIARKYHMESSLGRILDPFVDKVLICGCFIFLVGSNFSDHDSGRSLSDVAAWMVVLIIAREFLVTALRGFSEAQGMAFAATVYGKIKMFLQSATVVAILISIAHYRDESWARYVRLAFIWPMLIFTVLSMLGYISRAAVALKNEKQEVRSEK